VRREWQGLQKAYTRCPTALRKNRVGRLNSASGGVLGTHVRFACLKPDQRIVVQCKLYSSPVGLKAVQEIAAGKIHEQANHAIVVSNPRFTTAAAQIAATNGVLLLHHDDLSE